VRKSIVAAGAYGRESCSLWQPGIRKRERACTEGARDKIYLSKIGLQ
jgi:hypothetical protein